MPARSQGPRKGPRGGTTTATPGGFVRTTLHLTEEEYKYVRTRAIAETRSMSDVIRQALHDAYRDIPDSTE